MFALGVGRSCQCSTASLLLAVFLSLCCALGVSGWFVLRNQQQRCPHGSLTVVQPPLRQRQQSSDCQTYSKALPLTQAARFKYEFMTSEEGLMCLDLWKPEGLYG